MAICTLSQNPARRFGCIERAGKARGHDDENRDIDLSCILRSSSFPRSPRGSSPAGSSRWSCRWASVWRRTRGRSKMIAGRWNVERRQVRTNVGGRSSAMFAAKAAGRAVMKPKLGLHASNGTLFLASAGAFWTRQLTAASSGSASPATTSGTCLISPAWSCSTTFRRVCRSRRWTRAGLPARAPRPITVVAARRLARADAVSIGFVACGVQARAHLAALGPSYPITRVRAAYRPGPRAVADPILGTRAKKFASRRGTRGVGGILWGRVRRMG